MYNTLRLLSLLFFSTLRMWGQASSDSTLKYIQPRQFMVGTIFNFSSSDDTRKSPNGAVNGTSNLYLGGDLILGYVTGKHTALILKGGYAESTANTYMYVNASNLDLTDHNYRTYITPIFRYHVPVLDGNYFFVQVRVPLSIGTYVNEYYNTVNKTVQRDTYRKSGYGAYLVPGFTSFISKKLAAEIAAGSFGWETYDGTDDHGNVAHTGGFQSLIFLNSVSLGFVFYL